MKNLFSKSKLFLPLFVAAAVFSSCEKEKNLPTAGFTLSSDEAVQYDKITVTSTASGASEVSYTITGGEVMIDEANSVIQLLEDATYTIKQTAKNSDGTSETEKTIMATAPVNTYMLDAESFSVTGDAYWYDASAMGGTVYIRMLSDVDGQDNPNLIKLYPVSGANPVEGSYSFNVSGDVSTYKTGFTANYAGFNWDWTANGFEGDDLKIDLVYEAGTFTDNVYDITLTSSKLDYGNYDASWNWVSEGTKVFKVTYRGKIAPVAEGKK